MECTRGEKDGQLHEPSQLTSPPDYQLDDGAEESGPGPRPVKLSHYRVVLVMLALAIAIFIVAMDQSIIATATPYITNEFQSLDDVGWYASAYLFATCLCSLVWGKGFKYFTLRPAFVTALVIFEAGSVICATAPRSAVLIFGRAIAGVGGAGVIIAYAVIVSRLVSTENRALYDSCLGAVFSMASVVAPLIGGALTSRVTWRWCFWINLPCGFISALAVLAFVNVDQGHTHHQIPMLDKLYHLALPSATLFMGSIACLLLALEWGGTTLAWHDSTIIGLLVGAVLLMALFLLHQWRFPEQALIPSALIKRRSIYSSLIYIFLGGAATTIAEYYLPIWFQAIKGATPLSSGLMLLPFILSHLAFTITAGVGIKYFGRIQPYLAVGAAVLAAGLGAFSTCKPTSNKSLWIIYQIVIGAGAGLGIQAALLPAQVLLPSEQIATGISVINFGFVFGGALSVPIAQSILLNVLSSELSTTSIEGIAKNLTTTGITDIYKDYPVEDRATILYAYGKAVQAVFYLAAGFAVLSFIAAFGIQLSLSVKKNVEDLEVPQTQKDETKK